MKIHSKAGKIAIFSLVFLIFLLPPLFNRANPEAVFSGWTFPLHQLILFFLSILLLFIHESLIPDIKTNRYFLSYKIIFPSVFCSCLLLGFSFLINGLAILISQDSIQQKIEIPSDFTDWLFCSLTFIFSAFYEETIYRFYLPEALKDFCKFENKRKIQKALFCIIELLTALIFAFSHSYAGIFSVINALPAHIILRLCYKKTNSIYAGFISHFIYNMSLMILMSGF